ncbi:tetratricopeptide repeat protein [Ottowia sp.]|uniref:tetratricopeptide repeat protein n=1 Tax=Ottowia sp. TaxID=1898956 RepID=UPI002BA6432C|nr:tetratricopeptide repeat protein [Ottowia sp.]HRN75163.1 tetratricopeptide repeat protein [Ottowia sp.]HRQ03133.1 tetratricopeptide repeat protein [Ottowia sp.]
MNHPPTPSRWRARRLLPALIACGLWLAAPALALADEYAEVQRLQRAGQTSEALARADQYIGTHPRDPQMRFIKANVLSASGRGAEAQALLQQLTLDYPELAEPWNNLAVLHAGKGQLDLAQQALQAALRINPDYATALENLGDVQLRQAIQSYERARRLDAGNARLAPKIESLRGALSLTPKPGG